MTDCEHVRPQLTGYLDGDVDAETGAVVRGHLRECGACRDIAQAEAALRDGLRALPTVDPPSSMWNAVRARLAEAEVADAHRPAWRRAVARWTQSLSSSWLARPRHTSPRSRPRRSWSSCGEAIAMTPTPSSRHPPARLP